MMFKMKIFIISAAILGLVFTSCEDVIDVSVSDKNYNLYSVEAFVTTNNDPYVYLTRTVPVSSLEDPPGVSGANVSITDNAQPPNVINLVEDVEKKGYYKLPEGQHYPGVAGREYTLTIISETDTLTGKDYLTPVSPVDSIHVRAYDVGQFKFMAIALFCQEPPGKGNSYKWDVYINDTALYKTENMAIANDNLVDGKYVNDIEIFIDFYDPAKPQERKLNLNDTVYVRQNSISKVAYDFYTQMINQNQAGFLFSVTPANAKGNVTCSNGEFVMGMFSAMDVSVSNSVIIDENIESIVKDN
jgi:hypothetical protein